MSDYLIHHGILGQKWGIRRFQNPDGSLTAEGRKRYSDVESGSASKKEKAKQHAKSLNALEKKVAEYSTAGVAAGLVGDKHANKANQLNQRIQKTENKTVKTNLTKRYEKEKQKYLEAKENYEYYLSKVSEGRQAIDDLIERLYSNGYTTYSSDHAYSMPGIARSVYKDGEGFVRMMANLKTTKIGMVGREYKVRHDG